jgi:HEAT repeat protein
MQDQISKIDALLAELRNPDHAADASHQLTQIRDERVLSGLVSALDDPQPVVRTYAALGLADAGDPRHTKRLAALLQDPDLGVRSSAAFALGKVGHPGGALDALSAALRASLDLDAHLCRQLIIALADLGGEAAIEPLLHALKSSFPQVRIVATEHLGDVGTEQTVGQLKEYMQHENDDAVRKSLLEAINNIISRHISPDQTNGQPPAK